MDALSDTLNDIRPVPEPEPVPPKHVVKVNKQTKKIVIISKWNFLAVDVYLELHWLNVLTMWSAQEKEVVEERVSKPGERDDSLPPEYRPTEADIKVLWRSPLSLIALHP